MRAPLERRYRAISRLPTWDAPPSAVSQSPCPQSQVAIANFASRSSISLTFGRSPCPACTKWRTCVRSCGGGRFLSMGAALGAAGRVLLLGSSATRRGTMTAPTAARPVAINLRRWRFMGDAWFFSSKSCRCASYPRCGGSSRWRGEAGIPGRSCACDQQGCSHVTIVCYRWADKYKAARNHHGTDETERMPSMGVRAMGPGPATLAPGNWLSRWARNRP